MTTHTIRRTAATTVSFAAAAAAVAMCVVATGCAASASQTWAQNAPTIRAQTPAARQVQLGAWDEDGAERDDRN